MGIAGGLIVLEKMFPGILGNLSGAAAWNASGEERTQRLKNSASNVVDGVQSFATRPFDRVFQVGVPLVLAALAVKGARKMRLPSLKVLPFLRAKVA